MSTSTINTPKGKIEYSKTGQGKPILIIHGGHVNCQERLFQKGLDTNKYCLITPSRPGYGNTPLTDENKTPAGTADLFAAVLDTLGIPAVTVMGISAGGLTALEMAATYPGRVSKLVLMSALTKKWFIETDTQYTGGKKAFAPGIEKVTWLLYKLIFRLLPVTMTKLMFKQTSTYRPVQFTHDELRELKHLTMHMHAGRGFSNDLDQTIDLEILSGITCPTLILHSENDKAVDLSHPHNARNNIRNAQLITFKNRWGHLLWIGADYSPILTALNKFLA